MIALLLTTLVSISNAQSVENTMGNVIAVERVYDLDIDKLTEHLDKSADPRTIRASYVPVYPGTALVRVGADVAGYEPCKDFVTQTKLTVRYCARAEGYYASVSGELGTHVSIGEAMGALCATIQEARKHKFYANVLKLQ